MSRQTIDIYTGIPVTPLPPNKRSVYPLYYQQAQQRIHKQGLLFARQKGLDEGRAEGLHQGQAIGREEGQEAGWNVGYDVGFRRGFNAAPKYISEVGRGDVELNRNGRLFFRSKKEITRHIYRDEEDIPFINEEEGGMTQYSLSTLNKDMFKGKQDGDIIEAKMFGGRKKRFLFKKSSAITGRQYDDTFRPFAM